MIRVSFPILHQLYIANICVFLKQSRSILLRIYLLPMIGSFFP